MDIQELSQWTTKQVFAKTGKHLDSLQKDILEGILQQPDFTKIANNNGYSYDHVRKEGAKLWKILSDVFQEDIKQSNVRSILENKFADNIYNISSQQIIGDNGTINICRENTSSLEDKNRRSPSSKTQNQEIIINLNDAPEINCNYGRNSEINTLKEWLENKTRLITIYGLKGIGKTALILKLSPKIKENFDYIIYKSLEDKPKFITLKNELKNFFSQSQTDSITKIIDYFKSFRCLLIIDNLENIFKSGKLAGEYLTEYQEYHQFFEQIANNNHQSCLILISQEISPDIEILESNNNQIKTLKIQGLGESAKEILREKGLKNEEKWEKLINLYQTHPTWLNIISLTIKQLYNDNVTEFLTEENDLFIGDLKLYLQPHLERLSESEYNVINWLATENQPVKIAQISANLEISKAQSAVIVQSLSRRCLIEKSVIEEQYYYELNRIVKEYFKVNQQLNSSRFCPNFLETN